MSTNKKTPYELRKDYQARLEACLLNEFSLQELEQGEFMEAYLLAIQLMFSPRYVMAFIRESQLQR